MKRRSASVAEPRSIFSASLWNIFPIRCCIRLKWSLRILSGNPSKLPKKINFFSLETPNLGLRSLSATPEGYYLRYEVGFERSFLTPEVLLRFLWYFGLRSNAFQKSGAVCEGAFPAKPPIIDALPVRRRAHQL